jgi:hypothetical protein
LLKPAVTDDAGITRERCDPAMGDVIANDVKVANRKRGSARTDREGVTGVIGGEAILKSRAATDD